MSEKRIIGRAIQKHDIEENWLKATGFTPMQGEIIIYDIDENYNYERFKIGDGESNVNDLPFASISKLSELKNDVSYLATNYDTIINSQEEFDEMIADPTWLGAKNILLNCNVSFGQDPVNSSSPFNIPANICLINGNGHTIHGDNWSIIGNNQVIFKNVHLAWDKCSMENIYGFYNCKIDPAFVYNDGEGLVEMPPTIQCTNVISLTYTGDSSSVLATFSNCENIWLTTEQAAKFDTTNIGEAELHIVDEIPSYVYISRLSDLENNLGYAKLSDIPASSGEGEKSLELGALGVSAEGDYSVATGYAHTINGVQYPTTAKGTGSTAMGKGNTTYGKQSVAFGCYSTTGDKNGTAWDAEGEPFAGTDTPGEDLGKNSIAAGYNNSAWGESTVAMGSSNTAKGKSSTTIGNTNIAYGYGNVALGVKNTVGSEAPKENDASKFYYGHGGSGAQNTQSNSAVGIGRENEVTDTQSVGIGTSNKLYSKNVLALGTSNTINTNGDNSVAIGKNNEITNTNSVSLGYNNTIDKTNAIAIGSNQIVGKNNQIVIGNGGIEEEKADIILNGTNGNLLSLSETDGAYTFDTVYHDFTYPITDCRYHNYNSTARGPVFIADMNRKNEIPHLVKGQKITITINGIDYNSTINEVWGIYSPGSFTQADIFGNSKSLIRGAAFRIHESTANGPIYQALNALGNIDSLIDNIVLKIEDSSLNLASISADEKAKTINAITLGKNPIINSSTLFAIGNAVNSSATGKHNAFEVKNNGDVIIEGDILNSDGTTKINIPSNMSDLNQDLTSMKIGTPTISSNGNTLLLESGETNNPAVINISKQGVYMSSLRESPESNTLYYFDLLDYCMNTDGSFDENSATYDYSIFTMPDGTIMYSVAVFFKTAVPHFLRNGDIVHVAFYDPSISDIIEYDAPIRIYGGTSTYISIGVPTLEYATMLGGYPQLGGGKTPSEVDLRISVYNVNGFVHGFNNPVPAPYQAIFGSNAKYNPNANFVVGNGDPTAPKNTLEILYSGQTIVNGTLTVNGHIDGNILTPTENNHIANKKYVDETVAKKVANVVDSAPETLNTLNELSKALGNDENFATTVATQIGNLESEIDDLGTEIDNVSNSIPTKLSELSNDKLYQTSAEVNNKIKTTTKSASTISIDHSAGRLDPITTTKIRSAASCKSFMLSPESITIEYSNDGGVTWLDYGATDADKLQLFNLQHSSTTQFYLGKKNGSDFTTDDMLRVTISNVTDRYVTFDQIYHWVSYNAHNLVFDLDYSTNGDPSTFINRVSNKELRGWSGPNITSFSKIAAFGTNSNNNAHTIRLTYKMLALNIATSTGPCASSIYNIQLFGLDVYRTANDTIVGNVLTYNEPYKIIDSEHIRLPGNIDCKGLSINGADLSTIYATKAEVEALVAKIEELMASI